MPTKEFQRAQTNFTECSKLFESYGATVDAILHNALAINKFLRSTYQLAEWELDRLDEIRRDVQIYRSRMRHAQSKIEVCTATLSRLNKYLKRKQRNKEEEKLRIFGWIEMFLDCSNHQGEFGVHFRNAETKWSLIETDILSRHGRE